MDFATSLIGFLMALCHLGVRGEEGEFCPYFCARTLFLSKPKHPGRANAAYTFNLKHPEVINEAPFPRASWAVVAFLLKLKTWTLLIKYLQKEDTAVRQRATKRPR